jgi:hypothetical protein
MIFLPNTSKVVEVLNKRIECNLCFYEMALGLGLSYTGVAPSMFANNGTVRFSWANVSKIVQVAERLLL